MQNLRPRERADLKATSYIAGKSMQIHQNMYSKQGLAEAWLNI